MWNNSAIRQASDAPKLCIVQDSAEFVPARCNGCKGSWRLQRAQSSCFLRLRHSVESSILRMVAASSMISDFAVAIEMSARSSSSGVHFPPTSGPFPWRPRSAPGAVHRNRAGSPRARRPLPAPGSSVPSSRIRGPAFQQYCLTNVPPAGRGYGRPVKFGDRRRGAPGLELR